MTLPAETPMEFDRRLPRPALMGEVSAFTGYRELGGPGIRRRELPSGDIVFIVNFGEPFRILDPRGAYAPLTPRSGFLAGLHDSYAISESTGRSACMEFRLLPMTAHRLLRERMSAFSGRVVDLEDVFGQAALRLSGQLAAARDWPARFQLVERFLLDRLGDAPGRPELAGAEMKLRASGGNVPIRALAAETGYSGKHLVTLFRDAVGASPKAYARLLRFDRAAKMLAAGRHAGLADIALRCG